MNAVAKNLVAMFGDKCGKVDRNDMVSGVSAFFYDAGDQLLKLPCLRLL